MKTTCLRFFRLYGGETGLNFFSYFVVCGPLAVAALFLTWVILSLIYVPKWCRCFGEKSAAQRRQNQMRKAFLDQQHKELGPVRYSWNLTFLQIQSSIFEIFRQAEISVVVIFLVVITLWLTRQPQVFSGWGSLLQPGYVLGETLMNLNTVWEKRVELRVERKGYHVEIV
jgi:di/tricarboxylate transporter